MGTELQKKLMLFSIGARALAFYFRTSEEIYRCPICGRPFPIKAVYDGILTLEHVPPKSAGGKPLVLTCQDCNRTSGHSIDSAAATRQEIESIFDIFLGKREDPQPRRAEMIIHGNKVPIRMSRSGGSTKLQPVESASKPEALKGVRDVLHRHVRLGTGDGEEIKIEVTRKGFYPGAMISDLKTGFLAAFAFFGYGFALHRNLRQVREQILQPNLDIIGRRFHARLTGEESRPPTLLIAVEPFPCIVAILRNFVVLMPEPSGPGNLYALLSGQDVSSRFKGKILKWPKTMELHLDRSIREKNRKP